MHSVSGSKLFYSKNDKGEIEMSKKVIYPLELTLEKSFMHTKYVQPVMVSHPKLTLSLRVSESDLEIEQLRAELESLIDNLLNYY